MSLLRKNNMFLCSPLFISSYAMFFYLFQELGVERQHIRALCNGLNNAEQSSALGCVVLGGCAF